MQNRFKDVQITSWEKVYRSVPALCVVNSLEGKVSSSAFNDRYRKPSVDRALLVHSAIDTLKEGGVAVLRLNCLEIRRITIPVTDDALIKAGRREYGVDVLPRPKVDPPDNLAHAQIESDPAFDSDSRFRKMKESLARLSARSSWAVEPPP